MRMLIPTAWGLIALVGFCWIMTIRAALKLKLNAYQMAVLSLLWAILASLWVITEGPLQ